MVGELHNVEALECQLMVQLEVNIQHIFVSQTAVKEVREAFVIVHEPYSDTRGGDVVKNVQYPFR